MKRRTFLGVTTASVAGVSTLPLIKIFELQQVPEMNKDVPAIAMGLLDHNGNEVSYNGYKQILVPRDREHWTVKGTKVTTAKPINFNECYGRSCTAHYASLCIDGIEVFKIEMDYPINITTGVMLRLDLEIDGESICNIAKVLGI